MESERTRYFLIVLFLFIFFFQEIAMSFDVFVFDKNGMRRGPDLTHFLKVGA